MHRIPLSYNPIDHDKLCHVLQHYETRHHQEIISDFEKQISQLTGAAYVVALNSGTSAIHLALKALNVEKNDTVIAPTFTYVAAINPILYQLAIPIFVDCESLTWNLDPELVEKAIKECRKKPKAIIVVHTYGLPAPMKDLTFLSKKYGVPIVEDAAEALGSRYDGRHVGSFGEVGVLSFNNNKIVTTYGGGALLTDNENTYKKVLLWASQAREEKLYYEHKEVGYNYRMGTLNAAAGLAQWSQLLTEVDKRKSDFETYRRNLEPHGFLFLKESEVLTNNHWLSTALLPEAITPTILHQAMVKENIETRLLWNPMHKQPAFQNMKMYSGAHSERLFATGICLPCGKNLTEDGQNEIIEICVQLLEGY